MKVQEVMSKTPLTCSYDNSLADAAQLMWNSDVGFLPVVDPASRKLVGVLTDRDICMAAWMQNAPLTSLPVQKTVAGKVVTCTEDATLEAAQKLMGQHQLHRLPVVNKEGGLVGIITLSDLARASSSKKDNAVQAAQLVTDVKRPRPSNNTTKTKADGQPQAAPH